MKNIITVFAFTLVFYSCSHKGFSWECNGSNKSLGKYISEASISSEMLTLKDAKTGIEEFKNQYSNEYTCVCSIIEHIQQGDTTLFDYKDY